MTTSRADWARNARRGTVVNHYMAPNRPGISIAAGILPQHFPSPTEGAELCPNMCLCCLAAHPILVECECFPDGRPRLRCGLGRDATGLKTHPLGRLVVRYTASAAVAICHWRETWAHVGQSSGRRVEQCSERGLAKHVFQDCASKIALQSMILSMGASALKGTLLHMGVGTVK